jgi:hypothetical protein
MTRLQPRIAQMSCRALLPRILLAPGLVAGVARPVALVPGLSAGGRDEGQVGALVVDDVDGVIGVVDREEAGEVADCVFGWCLLAAGEVGGVARGTVDDRDAGVLGAGGVDQVLVLNAATPVSSAT